MRLELPYPPSVNAYRQPGVTRGRKPRAMVFLTKEAKAYKTKVRLMALSQGARPLKGEVTLAVTAYRPQKRGDIDNILKCLLDSLNGVLYEDDSQIVSLHVLRRDDKANPRVIVSVIENVASNWNPMVGFTHDSPFNAMKRLPEGAEDVVRRK